MNYKIWVVGEIAGTKEEFNKRFDRYCDSKYIKVYIEFMDNKDLNEKDALKKLEKGHSSDYDLIVTGQIYDHSIKGVSEAGLFKELEKDKYFTSVKGCSPKKMLTVKNCIKVVEKYINKYHENQPILKRSKRRINNKKQVVTIPLIEEQKKFGKLKNEQRPRIIENIDKNEKNILFEGPPGSGKTTIAVELAKYLATEYPAPVKTYYLCHNELLFNQIKRELYVHRNIEVHCILKELSLENYNQKKGLFGLKYNINKALRMRYGNIENINDNFIIDEAQLIPTKVLKILSASEGKCWAFWDPAQDLFEDNYIHEKLNWFRNELRVVFRSTRKNIKFLYSMYSRYINPTIKREIIIPDSLPEGHWPEIKLFNTVDEQEKYVEIKCKEIEENRIIAMLSLDWITGRDEKWADWQISENAKKISFDKRLETEWKGNTAYFTSAQKMTGLEFEVVFIVDVGFYNTHNERYNFVKRLYHAASRAQHILCICAKKGSKEADICNKVLEAAKLEYVGKEVVDSKE